MPKESGYFEEAWRLVDDVDPNVALIAHSAYRVEVEGSQKFSMAPEGGFNGLYFWQACIRLWLLRHPEVSLRDGTRYPYPAESIKAVNYDTFLHTSNDLVNDFVGLVREDSVPDGEAFDLVYAAAIVQLLFDREGNLARAQKRMHLSYEEWLSMWFRDATADPTGC